MIFMKMKNVPKSYFPKMEPFSEAALAADWKWGCGGRSPPPVPTNIPSSVRSGLSRHMFQVKPRMSRNKPLYVRTFIRASSIYIST